MLLKPTKFPRYNSNTNSTYGPSGWNFLVRISYPSFFQCPDTVGWTTGFRTVKNRLWLSGRLLFQPWVTPQKKTREKETDSDI